MSSIDFIRARAFIGAIPMGRWAAYRDVATAAGNQRGAQAIGSWLRREGYGIEFDYRVLTVDGRMPDTYASDGIDAKGARAKLRSEGVDIDDHGRAAQHLRFSALNWAP